jgi:hypothetical protein
VLQRLGRHFSTRPVPLSRPHDDKSPASRGPLRGLSDLSMRASRTHPFESRSGGLRKSIGRCQKTRDPRGDRRAALRRCAGLPLGQFNHRGLSVRCNCRRNRQPRLRQRTELRVGDRQRVVLEPPYLHVHADDRRGLRLGLYPAARARTGIAARRRRHSYRSVVAHHRAIDRRLAEPAATMPRAPPASSSYCSRSDVCKWRAN